MDLQEIQDKLNILLGGTERKIVFWYDDDAAYADPSAALSRTSSSAQGQFRLYPEHLLHLCLDALAGHRDVREHQGFREKLLPFPSDRMPRQRAKRHYRLFRGSGHSALRIFP